MSELYRYESRQRWTSMTLVLNMVVLLVLYFAASHLIAPSEEREQLFFWARIIGGLVELCLLLAAIYFWIQNGNFRMVVDSERFEISDPLSESASFSIPLNEIVAIDQTHQKQSNSNSIVSHTTSGERMRLTQTYHYNRTKLYAALAKANPDIRLPKNARRFKQV
ncbi:hypothetical protein [Rhodopirellula bahusiensis]|uniref:Uncharacterized protein n=1 Tax=Rhodopirellula bahusiensis TaxID=2014065 RepID=A0A2G1VZU2_9BACT|nr:hypothetical protein [Rhodopirellula bahusiensis]PHQ32241.1 hypothetical protein CEE69_26850 [Rhodopirellula bahusiensis]